MHSSSTALDRRQFFSKAELATLHVVPRHVAIIMDGNRRWGRKQPFKIMDPFAGHREGMHNLFRIASAAAELGVEHLTVYGFSTENWQRAPAEVRCLLGLIETALEMYENLMLEHGVRFQVLGDNQVFPAPLRTRIERVMQVTAQGTRLGLNVALNYGGRDELRRAMQRLGKDLQAGKLHVDDITEADIGRYLDTASLPEVDFLIRTSGEMRVSNFLLWQIAYSELYITPALWPEFSAHHLLTALQDYQQRSRRMGC